MDLYNCLQSGQSGIQKSILGIIRFQMNNNYVKFLEEAGMQQKDIKSVVNENIFGLRKRKKQQRSESIERKVVKQTLVSSVSSKEEKGQQIQHYILEFSPSGFIADYGNFRKGSKKQLVQWELKSIDLLTKMFEVVIKQKGIVELLSVGKWEQTSAFLRRNFVEVQKLGDEELLKIYMDHLIEYQFALLGTPLNIKKGTIRHSSLKNAIFISEKDRIHLQDKSLQQNLLHEEIVVIEGAVKKLGLQQVNLELIERECGQQQVQLRIQNPLDFGFNPYKLINKDGKMKITQYCDYQKHYWDENYCQEKFGDKLKGGRVFFAVNFQPLGGTLLEKLNNKLKDTMLGWALPKDMLSYLEQHINGCTNPQFYLKVKGVWTGGHQENIAMCAININHGPAASEWYTVPADEVERLRKTLKEKFRQDLYEQEGLWFEKINWFLENGIQIKRILQKPGDLVVSGPGTLHWVRGEGVSLHSAWNIFPQFYKSLVGAFHRHNENKKIKHRKSNTIPLKILTLKHLDHNNNNLDQETHKLLLSHLNAWFHQQESELARYKYNMGDNDLMIQERKLEEHQAFCKLCLQEIFVYFVDNWPDMGISCVFCLSENYQTTKINKTIYYRWSPGNMAMFLIQAGLKQLDPLKLRYCSGEHIGRQCILTNKIDQKIVQSQLKNLNKVSMQTQEKRQGTGTQRGQKNKDKQQKRFKEPQPKKRLHMETTQTQKEQGQFSERSCRQDKKKYKEDDYSSQQQKYNSKKHQFKNDRNEKHYIAEKEEKSRKYEYQDKSKDHQRERSRQKKKHYDKYDKQSQQFSDNEGPKSHYKKIEKNSDNPRSYRKNYDNDQYQNGNDDRDRQNNRYSNTNYKTNTYHNNGQFSNKQPYNKNGSYNNNNNGNYNNGNGDYNNNNGNYNNNNSTRNNSSNYSNSYNNNNNRGTYNNNNNTNFNGNNRNSYNNNTNRGGNYNDNKRTNEENTNKDPHNNMNNQGGDSKPERKRSGSQVSY